MELRRPTIVDREAVLDMMAEFERSQSPHDGGFWDTENFVYEEWLETNMQKEMGINLPENRVPSIQFVSFDDIGRALGFLNLRLRLNEGLLNMLATLVTPFVRLKEGKVMLRKLSVRACKLLRKRTSRKLL